MMRVFTTTSVYDMQVSRLVVCVVLVTWSVVYFYILITCPYFLPNFNSDRLISIFLSTNTVIPGKLLFLSGREITSKFLSVRQ